MNQQLENKLRIRQQFDKISITIGQFDKKSIKFRQQFNGTRHQLKNNSKTFRKQIKNWKTNREFDNNSTKFR